MLAVSLVSAEQIRSGAEASQHLAEEQLNQFLILFAQAPVAITVFRGKNFVIDLANPEVCRIWGRTEAAVLHKPFFEALPEAAGQGLEALLEGVLSTGVPYVGKELLVRLARADGGGLEDVYFDFVYQPMRDPAGRVERILVVANDVRTFGGHHTNDFERDVFDANGLADWVSGLEEFFDDGMSDNANFVGIADITVGEKSS